MKRGVEPKEYATNLSVADSLRAYIACNGLQAGERLPTHQMLCEELGVGLRRLREGLSILRQQGLIETKRRGGTVIKSFSTKAIEDHLGWGLEEQGCSFEHLVRARAAMESAAADEAATTRRARDMLVILDAVERMEAVDFTSPRHEETDEQFHMAILQATNNPALLTFGKLIAGQFTRKKSEVNTETASAWKRSNVEHRAILQAIENRDSESARKKMYEHIIGQLREVKVRRSGRTKA